MVEFVEEVGTVTQVRNNGILLGWGAINIAREWNWANHYGVIRPLKYFYDSLGYHRTRSLPRNMTAFIRQAEN